MHTSLNNDISNPQMCSSLLSNYHDDSFHFETPQEHYHAPSSFLVPSPIYIPLEDEAVFCEFFQQELLFVNDYNHNTHEMTNNSIGECSNNNGKNVTNHGDDDHGDVEPYKDTLKKRPTNRDRHSKINTARGLRDRRIRLSLDVAKKLFGLQDMLGFDKASKTIDWLLTKSNTAILDLFHRCSFIGESNNTSSTSECEVVSRTSNQLMVKTGDDQGTTKTKALKSSSGNSIKKKGKTICVRKCDLLAKETRVIARQRARKRTIEKQKYKDIAVGVDDQDSTFSQVFDQVMDLDVNAQGSWSIFEDNQHLIMDQMNASFQFCQGFVDDNSPLWMTDSCPPFYLSD